MTHAEDSRQPDDSHPPSQQRLACPQCRALYQTTRPTFGRRVRCRHCGHVWRDETRLQGRIADALSHAADGFGTVGSTLIAQADHGSTLGKVVSGMEQPPVPPPADWVGKSFGRYDIKSVLGQGAMGYVFEAVDRELKREVALKVLPRRFNQEREPLGVRMFIQEARIAARLQHPNIVTILDIGNEAGLYYFAMERVHGITLATLIEQKGPLPANQACYVIAHVALALAAAHKAGVIHRDVKPSNVMIDQHGRVKVTDFGLADVQTAEGVAEVRERIMGTPGWIAPEVARGQKATAASDLYSLGLTLYAALTGSKLIHAPTKSGMVRLHQSAISLRRDQLPPGWPSRLTDIVMQCLQADPRHRYQSGEMLAADLFRALAPDRQDATFMLEEEAPTAPRTVRAVPPWLSGAVLGLLAALVLAYAAWYWWR